MKKRKFSLLLNIATICLCVCAIAIGVYSAKTASLTVSGTIGFSAHNVKAAVSLSVKGDAVDSSNAANANGTISRAEYKELATANITDSNQGTTQSLSWTDSIYFCDLASEGEAPCDIYLKISVTNNSDYQIMASFTSAPTIEGVTVSIADGSSSYVKVANGSTGDIVLKLSVTKNSKGEYPEITATNNVNFSMKLEKRDDFFVAPITGYGYNSSTSSVEEVGTANRLCTYLGHGTTTDEAEFEVLRWYAFAVRGKGTDNTTDKPDFVPDGNEKITVGTETWYSLTGVDMSTVDYKGYTFWFIQELCVYGPEFNIYDADHKTSYDTYNQYADNVTEGKKYQSDIYKYINGDGDTDYQAITGIKNDTTINVNARTIDESETTQNYSGTKVTQPNRFTSKYWLISAAELGLLANSSMTNSSSGLYNHIQTYRIGDKTGFSGGLGENWWLRSPYLDSGAVFTVYNEGGVGPMSANAPWKVRAAFQISI